MKYTYIIEFAYKLEGLDVVQNTVRFYSCDEVFTNKSLQKGSKLYHFFCHKYFTEDDESIVGMKITEVFENEFGDYYKTLSGNICKYLCVFKGGVDMLTDFFISESKLKSFCKYKLYDFEQEIAIRQYIYDTIDGFNEDECLIINHIRKIAIDITKIIGIDYLAFFEKMTKPTDENYKAIKDETYVPKVGSYNARKIDYDNIDNLSRDECAIMAYYKCLHITEFVHNMLNCLLSTYFSRFGVMIEARNLGDYLEKFLDKIDYIMNLLVAENPLYTISYSTNLLVNNTSYRSREKILEDLCPPKYQEKAVKVLYNIDDYYNITNGKYDKLTLAAVCLALKKSILFYQNIKTFEKFKKLICEYFQVPTPSYKENDCKHLVIDIKNSFAFNEVPFK